MFSEIIREAGEIVTVVRFSENKDGESIIARGVACVIDPVEGQYDHWKATLANSDVRDGDILRRGNGSELQVLRSDTQTDFMGEDITELDLKDYDRQKPLLQENEMDMLRSDFLPEHQFHSMIPQNVWLSFSHGANGSAVFEAFKQVEIAVRKVGGYADTDYGTDLMRKAFHVDSGNLMDENQPPAEKQARSDLFAGAIGAYKNPGSHRDVDFTAEEAVELIGLASYLLRIVDSRNQTDGDSRNQTDGEWQEQFANGFVRHLKNRESPLMDPEVFMGEDAPGYPRYIGFNIGKIEDLDIRDRDAFWLVASTIHDGKIYLKLQMNDSNYFSQLESQKAAIEHKFGESLKWEPGGQGQRIRIGVDLEVNPLDENRGQWNQRFEDMREKLEKLNEIFQSRIEAPFSHDDIPF